MLTKKLPVYIKHTATKKPPMLNHEFQELIEDADYTTHSYSGRGMYGKDCLGVELDDNQSVLQFIADLMNCAREQDKVLDDIIPFIRGAKEDSMGCGIVVYFPDVEYTSDFEDVCHDCEGTGVYQSCLPDHEDACPYCDGKGTV
jgi:hypothetical protein